MKREKTNKNRIKWGIVILFSVVISTIFTLNASGSQYEYRLLEPLPGFTVSNSTDTQFPQYVLALYQFGTWTVGIAAMFMLIFGGFMYVTSAGNTSRLGTARGVITGALTGLVAALCAYLLLNIINPDLVNIDLRRISCPPGNMLPECPHPCLPGNSDPFCPPPTP